MAESAPARGVRVKVRVYGKVEIGWPLVPIGVGAEAAGRVVNRRPVDRPTTEETGE